MRIHWRAAGAAVAIGVVLLGGCGSDGGSAGGSGGESAADSLSGSSAEEIVEAAKTDMGELDTMRMSGTLTTDGGEAELDLQVSGSGDCAGSVTVDGTKAELRTLDGKSWVRTDQTAGEWLAMSLEDSPFGELCDIDTFLGTLDPTDDEVTEAGKAVVDGQDVVQVIVVGSEDGTESLVSVLADAPHYMVRIEVTADDEPGTITISDFDDELEVEAPADDEIADPSSLG